MNQTQQISVFKNIQNGVDVAFTPKKKKLFLSSLAAFWTVATLHLRQ